MISKMMLLGLGLGVAAAAHAGEVRFAPPGTGGLELVPDRAGIVLECRLEALAAEVVATPRGAFVAVSAPGATPGGVPGTPALPVIARLVEVPAGARVTARVETAPARRVTLAELGTPHPILPRQPPQPKDDRAVPFAFERSAYRATGLRQEGPVDVEDLGMLRDRHLVRVSVSPVAYDPVAGRLEVTPVMRVALALDGADLARTEALKERLASPWFDAACAGVLRPAWLAAPPRPRRAAPGYLIVADRMFAATLDPFVRWKTAQGFRVTVGYTDTIGRTAEAIRGWIASAFAEAPVFLLLVGDTGQIPPFPGRVHAGIPPGEHITDLYYAALTPGDDLPDLLTGRFSARTPAELSPQIEKTLAFERGAARADGAALVAGWDGGHAVEWGWPEVRFGASHWFDAAHHLPRTRTFLSTGPQQNARAILDAVDAGCAFVTYSAHGSAQRWSDPQISVSEIAELRNTNRYPLVIGNCCLTAAFQMDTCFAEAWLRAPDRGAIGYIGASDNTFWDEDLWWSVGTYPIAHPNPGGDAPDPAQVRGGAFAALFAGPQRSAAGALLAGNLAVAASSSPVAAYYREVYHLMGDPSLAPGPRDD